MRKRNPMARELRLNPLYRARCGKTRRQAEQRGDRWNRAAKHKPPKGTPGSSHGPGDFFAAAGARSARRRCYPAARGRAAAVPKKGVVLPALLPARGRW